MNVKELLLKLPSAVSLSPDAPDATIQFDTAEPVHLVVQGGAVSAHEGQAPSSDVTVKASDDNLLKLMLGELNPMTAMMTGRLRVKGNAMLAQRLIGMVDRSKLEATRDELLGDQRA